ncbi:MAG TPA: PQQ-dependent sugar dehydrogenase [Solirubrobacterales bacterium]|nr:PQQ-dependent sugar dehydrogenase [Solirubrobacterales bacterium]
MIALVLALFLGLTTTACAEDSPAPPDATSSRGKPRLTEVANFNQPVEIKSAPGYDGLMFVVEQEGRVMVLRKGRKLARPFLDIRGRVEAGGERGLLSVAFPPDYRKSKRFYVYYTDSTGDIRVDEFRRRSAVRADSKSGRPVITIPHRENSNHNGGQLQFHGHDLYFGTGDGGGGGDQPGNAQNKDVLLGKMIRIDPRAAGGRPYTVPASNPYVGRDGRDEIFAIGLRNPFRWSFVRDPAGGTRMMIGDVGQDRFEEINSVPLGRALGGNFGWNKFEGYSVYDGAIPGTIKPAVVLSRGGSNPNLSVVGGLVVRDRKVPALRGRYIFTDFFNGDIRWIPLRSGRQKARSTGVTGSSITSFGSSNSGTVYATSLSGPVFRLTQ